MKKLGVIILLVTLFVSVLNPINACAAATTKKYRVVQVFFGDGTYFMVSSEVGGKYDSLLNNMTANAAKMEQTCIEYRFDVSESGSIFSKNYAIQNVSYTLINIAEEQLENGVEAVTDAVAEDVAKKVADTFIDGKFAKAAGTKTLAKTIVKNGFRIYGVIVGIREINAWDKELTAATKEVASGRQTLLNLYLVPRDKNTGLDLIYEAYCDPDSACFAPPSQTSLDKFATAVMSTGSLGMGTKHDADMASALGLMKKYVSSTVQLIVKLAL